MFFPRLTRPLLILIALIVLAGPLSRSTLSAGMLTRLTTSGDVNSIQWLPDGRIAFTRPAGVASFAAGGKQELDRLYLTDANGAAPQGIAQDVTQPSVSPDGAQVAFLTLNPDGSGDLNLLDLDSRQVHDKGKADRAARPKWTRDGNVVYQDAGHALTVNAHSTIPSPLLASPVADAFAVSPGGDRLAYLGPDGLHVAFLGSDRLAFAPGLNERLGKELVWSHDGKRLAFLVTADQIDPQLVILDLTTGQSERLLAGKSEYLAGIDWAPDDGKLILTRTPTGNEVNGSADIWKVTAADGRAEAITQNHEEETSPRYSPDGGRVAFLRNGDIWLLDLAGVQLPLGDASRDYAGPELTPLPPPSTPSVTSSAQLAPPATIRVYHSQYNTCRNEPVGQIDTLDFETYVKRVVPAEVYASWPAETLKAQAVAARTYAWTQVVNHTTWDYDVTDSTSYQYMCDNQYTSTDAAVDATRGQYAAYAGALITAMYSANNGDPTTTNSNPDAYPYLTAVDDPVDFANAVNGHGMGLSQWGASRWAAAPYGWSYQQILTHYYSGITVQSPSGSLPDSAPPIGGMVSPWSNWGLASNSTFLQASASDDATGVAGVTFNARYWDGSTFQTTPLPAVFDGRYWTYVSDLSALPDQAGMTITPSVVDGSGHSFSGNGLQLLLDRQLPVGSVSGPQSTTSQTVNLTLTGSDNGPGGLTGMAFSNNWIWEGENQSVTSGSGTVVDDPGALNGKALKGTPGTNPAGVWYGPYTTGLALNQPYRAYFRLKTDNNRTGSEVALLDVVDNAGTNLFGLKRLRGTDFKQEGSYQEFYVDFYPNGTMTQGLEFRVAYRATASLWLDRVIVVTYPEPFALTKTWLLSPGEGAKLVQAKIVDGAGNISADAVASIFFGTPPPVLEPRVWLPLITR